MTSRGWWLPLLRWQCPFLLMATLIGLLWAYGSRKAWIEVTLRHPPALTAWSSHDHSGNLLSQKSFDYPHSQRGFSLPIDQQQLPVVTLTADTAHARLFWMTLSNHGDELHIRWPEGLSFGQHIHWDLHRNELSAAPDTPANLAENQLSITFSALPDDLQSQPLVDFLYVFVAALIAAQTMLLLGYIMRARFRRILWR